MNRQHSSPAIPGAEVCQPPAWITPALIERTITVWQSYYSNRLTPQDAIDILIRVGRLIDVLQSK